MRALFLAGPARAALIVTLIVESLEHPRSIRLVVGLGNVGAEYQATRHNAGYWLVDSIARREGARFGSERKFQGDVARVRLGGHDVWLLKPTTYMLQLEVPIESEGDVVKVRVWNDEIAAVTQGEIADAWFSRFLGRPAQLRRFDPEARRLSNTRFTGATEAPYKFADAFALLVTSSASLVELNRRLAQRKIAAVGIERFRPNIVLAGTDAFEEDYVAQLTIGASELRLVKPCVRCSVPNVDPTTGESSSEPGDTLTLFRDNARAGGVTFGMATITSIRLIWCRTPISPASRHPTRSTSRCSCSLSAATCAR